MKSILFPVLFVAVCAVASPPIGTPVAPTLQAKGAPPVQRFQMFFSSNARGDTFLLDTSKGDVWLMSEVKSEQSFSPIIRSLGIITTPPPPPAEGRYTMAMDPSPKGDCYIIDTKIGQMWRYTEGRPGESSFQMVIRYNGVGNR